MVIRACQEGGEIKKKNGLMVVHLLAQNQSTYMKPQIFIVSK